MRIGTEHRFMLCYGLLSLFLFFGFFPPPPEMNIVVFLLVLLHLLLVAVVEALFPMLFPTAVS
jgi:hypothetical protein